MLTRSRVFILFLAMCTALAGPLLALSEEENGAVLAAALADAKKGDWQSATAKARRIADPVAADIITWMRLRKGEGTWEEYRHFLGAHADWPGLSRLRQRSEAAMPDEFTPGQTVAFYANRRPQTGLGVLRLGAAYEAIGKPELAHKEIIRAWRSFAMTKGERKRIYSRYRDVVAPHHRARLDMLLWRNLKDRAEGLYSLVPKGHVTLAKARLALRNRKHGVDALIAAVPKDLRDDPGLAYERFRWRAAKGLRVSARDLLIKRSVSAASLGRPDMWAGQRRSIARQEMRDGNYRRAYNIAASHFLKSGSDYADLEWLSGYIALRYLDDPARALSHFNRFRAAIATPISYGRAGYWQGRALEVLGDKKAAREAYAFAARYQTSFYGQLAAERVGAAPDPRLAGSGQTPDWRLATFVRSEVVRAALLFHYASEPGKSEWFFRKAAEGLDGTGFQQLADLAMEIGRPNVAVRLSKLAARKGFVLPKTYFPITDLARKKLPVKPEVAMSIARRESELDAKIISPAGARGLMQLMPGTAKKVARKLGVPYSRARLTDDWEYNALLGSTYLADQLKTFDGSYILAFAAYNAGPSRARRWIGRYGDPRKNRLDQVDWIEHIPFRETRNYVMRVIESLYVYRARIRGRTPAIRISRDLEKG